MGSKPVKSGEGVMEVRYKSQRSTKPASSSVGGETDSKEKRGSPQSTPLPTDSLSVEGGPKDKRRGFTYSSSEKHRRENPRETKMMDDQGDSIDKGFLFRKEKVHRVPTRAVLKPPKSKNSVVADPDDEDDDEDYDDESRGASPALISQGMRSEGSSNAVSEGN